MKKFKNKILVLLLIAFCPILNAQIYVGAGTGVYSLSKNYNNFAVSNDTGFNLKIGYIKSINSNFGIGLGAEYSKSNYHINTSQQFSIATNLIDDVNSAFVYNVDTDGYREDQELSAFQIPLFLQFKTKVGKFSNFYLRAGGKYFIPQQFKTTAIATKVTGTGYYPDFNLTITDYPEHGFGTTYNYSESGEYETKNVVMLNLEFGFSFKVGSKSTIYTGFFLDKATGTIVESKNNVSFIGYNPTSINNRKLNGLYNSKLDGEVMPVNFGITLSYSFGR